MSAVLFDGISKDEVGNVEKVSYMCQKDLHRQQERYKDAIRAQAAAGKLIVLYGAGMYGRKILSMLRQEHIQVHSLAVTQRDTICRRLWACR